MKNIKKVLMAASIVAMLSLTACEGLVGQNGIPMLNGTPLGELQGTITHGGMPTIDDDFAATVDLSSNTGVSNGWLDQNQPGQNNRDWRIIGGIAIDGWFTTCSAIRRDLCENTYTLMSFYDPAQTVTRAYIMAEGKNIAWQGTLVTNKHITDVQYFNVQQIAPGNGGGTGSIEEGTPIMKISSIYVTKEVGDKIAIITTGYTITYYDNEGLEVDSDEASLDEFSAPELKSKMALHMQTMQASNAATAQN
jgi:hypothetical protein